MKKRLDRLVYRTVSINPRLFEVAGVLLMSAGVNVMTQYLDSLLTALIKLVAGLLLSISGSLFFLASGRIGDLHERARARQGQHQSGFFSEHLRRIASDIGQQAVGIVALKQVALGIALAISSIFLFAGASTNRTSLSTSATSLPTTITPQTNTAASPPGSPPNEEL